jgi:hypothetical protein
MRWLLCELGSFTLMQLRNRPPTAPPAGQLRCHAASKLQVGGHCPCQRAALTTKCQCMVSVFYAAAATLKVGHKHRISSCCTFSSLVAAGYENTVSVRSPQRRRRAIASAAAKAARMTPSRRASSVSRMSTSRRTCNRGLCVHFEDTVCRTMRPPLLALCSPRGW